MRPDRIDRLWPDRSDDLDDETLVRALREDAPTLRMNFVSSVNGAATRDGLSGGLSTRADQRYFELLRRVADVVVVGAGTLRAEGYGPLRVSDASARWRAARGLPEHPRLGIVTRTADVDRSIIKDAPVRPILFTVEGADVPQWVIAHADVVVGAGGSVDGREVVASLTSRGLVHVLCEGGPHLFASLLDADVVDELCLTVSPQLVGGDSIRITEGLAADRALALASVQSSESTLLLRYARAAASGAGA